MGQIQSHIQYNSTDTWNIERQQEMSFFPCETNALHSVFLYNDFIFINLYKDCMYTLISGEGVKK